MRPPTLEEVRDYCEERQNGIDAEDFWLYYETNGWVQGKHLKPIKSWKACVMTWERNRKHEKRDFVESISDRSWADPIPNIRRIK